MRIFKSKDERRIERDLEVRRGLAVLRKSVKNAARHEEEFVVKARRAHEIGDADQYAFLRGTIRRTAAQRRLVERQLLSLETAMQIRDQAESHAQFAESLRALSGAIGKAFGSADLAKTQLRFEQALSQARTIEERMELFLETTNELMIDEDGQDSGLSDQELDLLIAAEEA